MDGKYCRWCKYNTDEQECAHAQCYNRCPTDNVSWCYEDATAFEARAARKLATFASWTYDDGWDDRLNVREYKRPDYEESLKWARLTVESEMEN